jgi:hypothetical protein
MRILGCSRYFHNSTTVLPCPPENCTGVNESSPDVGHTSTPTCVLAYDFQTSRETRSASSWSSVLEAREPYSFWRLWILAPLLVTGREELPSPDYGTV